MVRILPESCLDEAADCLQELEGAYYAVHPLLPTQTPERGHSTVIEMRPQRQLQFEA